MLAAARARAEGLPSIVVPAVLAVLVAVGAIVLMTRASDTPMSMFAVPVVLGGLVSAWLAVRYGEDGQRARAYLRRFA